MIWLEEREEYYDYTDYLYDYLYYYYERTEKLIIIIIIIYMCKLSPINEV